VFHSFLDFQVKLWNSAFSPARTLRDLSTESLVGIERATFLFSTHAKNMRKYTEYFNI
jgi:hypothetical protein